MPQPTSVPSTVRGVVWIAEVAAGIGLTPDSILWVFGDIRAQMPTRTDLDALADRLGLADDVTLFGNVNAPLASRAGTYADINVSVYGPAS